MSDWQAGDHVLVTSWTSWGDGLDRAPARILKVSTRQTVRGPSTVYTVRLDPVRPTVSPLPLYLSERHARLERADGATLFDEVWP